MNHDITKCIEDLAARCVELDEKDTAYALSMVAQVRKDGFCDIFVKHLAQFAAKVVLAAEILKLTRL